MTAATDRLFRGLPLASSTTDQRELHAYLLEYLDKGDIETFVEETQETEPEGLDLRGRDLSGLDLSGAWLVAATLKGAGVKGTRLFGTRLEDADLRGLNLADAHIFLVRQRST